MQFYPYGVFCGHLADSNGKRFPDEVKIGLPGSKEFMSGNELLKQLKELEAHFLL